jgi:hypothetical protein
MSEAQMTTLVASVTQFAAGCKQATQQAQQPKTQDQAKTPSTSCGNRRARRFTPFPRTRRDMAACSAKCATDATSCMEKAIDAGDGPAMAKCGVDGPLCGAACAGVPQGTSSPQDTSSSQGTSPPQVTSSPQGASSAGGGSQGGNICEQLAATLKTVDCKGNTACDAAVSGANADLKAAAAAGVDGTLPFLFR